MWELEHGEDDFSLIADLQKKGARLPQWWHEQPAIDDLGRYFLRAWSELSTCRPGGLDLLPIPWTAIVAYGDRDGLSADAATTFHAVIRQMDEAFLRDRAKHRPRAEPEPKTDPEGPRWIPRSGMTDGR